MEFRNTTRFDTARLESLFRRCAHPWPLDGLDVQVRYTRSTPFSGLCCYGTRTIRVNIGRHNRYPYKILTHVAKAQTTSRGWRRPLYSIAAADAYQLALFVFMHELYHWLVRKAGRNTRQKESRCDRFAVRTLVEEYGASVIDENGLPVDRDDWDFQDLDGFVLGALSRGVRRVHPDQFEPAVAATKAEVLAAMLPGKASRPKAIPKPVKPRPPKPQPPLIRPLRPAAIRGCSGVQLELF